MSTQQSVKEIGLVTTYTGAQILWQTFNCPQVTKTGQALKGGDGVSGMVTVGTRPVTMLFVTK